MENWMDRFFKKWGPNADVCCPHCASGPIKIKVQPSGSPDPDLYTCLVCGFKWDDNDPLDVGAPDGTEVVPFGAAE